MVLLSFSDPKHVPMILDGRKKQTTRKPRTSPIRAGDILHVYYKSRMRKTCNNCLKYHSITGHVCPVIISDSHYCPRHTNFFGTAKVVNVCNFDPNLLSRSALESWAKADGFESFEEANQWFSNVHGPDWASTPWVLVFFEGDWISKGD